MSDAAGAGRAQDVASGVGALFQGYQSYQEGEAMKADAASQDRLAAAIGQFFEKGSTPGVSPYGTSTPKVASSKSGAGNPFAPASDPAAECYDDMGSVEKPENPCGENVGETVMGTRRLTR